MLIAVQCHSRCRFPIWPSVLFSGRIGLVGLLFSALTFVANAQSEWTYLESKTNCNAWTRDILELPDGYVIAATVREGPPGSNAAVLRKLSPTGLLITGYTLPTTGSLPNVCCLTPPTADRPVTAYGVLVQPDGVPAFFKQPIADDLSPIAGSNYAVPGRERLFMENLVEIATGEVLLMGGGIPGTTAFMEGHAIRLGSDGSELGRTQFLSQNGIDVIPLQGFYDEARGYMLGMLGSVLGSGFYRLGQFLWMNDDLVVTQHFLPREPVQPVGSPHLTITDSPCAVPLPSGEIIVSGTYGTLTQGTGCLLLRMNADGDTLAYFLPPRGTLRDHTAALQALTMDADGNLLYCQMENLQPSYNLQGEITPLEPTEPSRVRIMRLDTSFNVLCEQVIDGYAESAYYLPTRIKPTSDGGYVVIGARRQLNSTERAMMWAAKFTDAACVNSVVEHQSLLDHSVFPNPGVDGFNVVLSGPRVPQATIQLMDALGRIVATSLLHDSKGWLSTEQLAPAVYHYQIVDSRNTLLAQGKWVRE